MELENNGRDPNTRRRLDGQAMMDRDEQVARLREQGVPFRAIAARLGCSLGSVQKAVRRARARRADRASAAVDDVDEEPAWPVRSVGVDEAGAEWWVDERGRRFN
jgi:DNA-binding CsgD family transcriptional regulator